MLQLTMLQNSHSKKDSFQMFRIQNENYLLHQQLQDIKTKYLNLKKQHQIWEQINNNDLQAKQQTSSLQKQQMQYLKQQFVNIIKQKEQLQHLVKQLRQKVQDLKYTNIQLKQLNEKQQKIHQKQIQITKIKIENDLKICTQNSSNLDRNSHSYNNSIINPHFNNQVNKFSAIIKQLQRKVSQKDLQVQVLEEQIRKQKDQNNKNQIKLQKCSQITKQMEEYYNNQIQNKQQMIKQLQIQMNQYQTFQSPKTKIVSHLNSEECSSLKCSSVVSQYQHNQALSRGDYHNQIEQKYEKALHQAKLNYEKEISKYQQKIRYLLLRVESLEAERKYWQSNNVLSNDQQLEFNGYQIFTSGGKVQQSLNLKLSKASHSESLSNFMGKEDLSTSIRQSNISSKQKITSIKSIKTPNKSLQKGSNQSLRNSFNLNYQRIPLNESNYCNY